VMGWALAARALPFVGVTGEMQAAKRQGLPPLRGVVDLPETYLEWLRWLAEPSPVQRPQSAQEALAALRALGPPVPTLASAGIAEGFSDVLTWNTLAVVDTEPMARVRAEDPPSPDVPSRRARLPEDWRRGSLRDPPLKLRGAGLGLLAWRDPELVGHVAARDALWRHAREPIAPVRVRGLAGVGKSAVGRWLVRTVRSWGGFGFTCDASSQRDALWLAMTQIAAAVCEAPAPEASWTNARLEASVREWLAAVSSRAATVVHLDATGPGSDLLAALCAGLSEPVSVVWTVGSAPARPIDLELLPVAKLAEILTRYAGVEAASAVRLANAANGLPGVALDQMRAAITREAFRWASTGLVIDRVPPRPQRSWGIRMDEAQLLDLQCAAAIGVDVPAALWEPLCQSGASWAAVRGLARQGLAALTATGFRFLDAGLREWLLVRAGADRSDLHRAVLRVVEERYDGPDRDLWRARQLTELGRMDEAYPCWKEAFWLRRQEDGCHALAVLVFELQAMMDRVGLPASDPRRGMLRATLIQGWRTGGEQEACLREVESLLQDPHAALWPLAVAKGLLERARANLFADLEMAWAELQEAEGLLDGVSPDDDEARLSCVDVREHRLWLRYDRARLLGLRGEPQARLDALRALCADAALSSCAEIEADACCELAMDLLASEPEEAWSWAVRAREVNEGLGRMLGAADAWSVSGHVARRLGQVDRATEAYRTSIAMHQELESAFGIFPCLGLARLQLEQGALSEAAESIRRGMIVGRDLGPSLRGYALCLQAICDVRLGDLDAALSGFETVAEIRERHEVAISELTDVLLAIRADEDAVLLHPILDVLLAAPSGP